MQDQAINDIYFEHTVHQNLNLLSKETNTRLQNAKKKIFRKLMSLNMAVWVETVVGVY